MLTSNVNKSFTGLGYIFSKLSDSSFIPLQFCTVIVVEVVLLQPKAVPVIVYVLVEVGLAETEFPVVELNPVDGLHE